MRRPTSLYSSGSALATRLAKLFSLLALAVFLAACGGGDGGGGGGGGDGGGGGGGGGGGAFSAFTVTPSASGMNLTWSNSRPVAGVNISWLAYTREEGTYTYRRSALADGFRRLNATEFLSGGIKRYPLAAATYSLRSDLYYLFQLQEILADGSLSSARPVMERINTPRQYGTDSDGDGFADTQDNCPMMFNPNQADADNDFLGNVCDDADDRTPDIPADQDADGDGILNADDLCPQGDENWTSDSSTDLDGDGCRDDGEDVDDDGDGLIEISNAHELNNMRYNLAGTSYDDEEADEGDGNDMGSAAGCGGQDGITACRGYELTANINLQDQIYAGAYDNWQPLSGTTRFSGRFDGNGYSINNINIEGSGRRVGFFAGTDAGAELHNISLVNINISAAAYLDVGGLVGEAHDTIISSSAVIAGFIRGNDRVGGLVGRPTNTEIISSVAVVDSISGANFVGGLLGVDIRRVGSNEQTSISYSSAIVGAISVSGNTVGGLAGTAVDAAINSSYAVVGAISGPAGVGGLVGQGANDRRNSTVSNGYVLAKSINSTNNQVDGLSAINRVIATQSYWLDRAGLFTGMSPATPGMNGGENKSMTELQTPANDDFATASGGIYSSWGNAWCNPATGEFAAQESSPGAGYRRAWDFGTSGQYPALNCVPLTLSQQRALIARVFADPTASLLPLPSP